ncbi:carbonic anhydrase [Dongia sp.]|uniref:carbonic anhydrase n=1 Tax=Dongia sp. TaxID=1977262 RepID=UPI0035B1338E
MEKLIDGYRRFRADVWPAERERYRVLAEKGQRPETMVIACSDSRVDPQTVFGCGPGELFVVRNVAALVPPYSPDGGYHGTSAALEFAVRVLQVKRLVVLGHARCGGVQAMAEGAPETAQDFVVPWVSIAQGALDRVPHQHAEGEEHGHAHLDLCEMEVIRLTLGNLLTFPWIRDAVAAGALAIHGFRFDIHTGILARVTDKGLQPVS